MGGAWDRFTRGPEKSPRERAEFWKGLGFIFLFVLGLMMVVNVLIAVLT